MRLQRGASPRSAYRTLRGKRYFQIGFTVRPSHRGKAWTRTTPVTYPRHQPHGQGPSPTAKTKTITQCWPMTGRRREQVMVARIEAQNRGKGSSRHGERDPRPCPEVTVRAA